MFDFIKKKNKKENNKSAIDAKVAYYKNSLLPQLRDEWVNNELPNLTGIANLFESNAHIVKQLSREELFECYRCAHNSAQKPARLLGKVERAVDEYLATHDEIVEQYSHFIHNGKQESSAFRYQNDYYVVEILRQMLNNVEIEDDVAKYKAETQDLTDEELLIKVNDAIQGFVIFESLLAKSLAMSTDLALMQQRLKLMRT